MEANQLITLVLLVPAQDQNGKAFADEIHLQFQVCLSESVLAWSRETADQNYVRYLIFTESLIKNSVTIRGITELCKALFRQQSLHVEYLGVVEIF